MIHYNAVKDKDQDIYPNADLLLNLIEEDGDLKGQIKDEEREEAEAKAREEA